MNTTSKFERLTFATKSMRNFAHDNLMDAKSGIAALGADLNRIGDALCWNAENWAVNSYRLQWANWSARALSIAAEEAYAEIMADADSDSSAEMEDQFNAELDRRAAAIIRELAAEAFATIFRGVEGSSNPMRAIDSAAKVEAAKKALESMCGISSWNAYGRETINDIFSGMDRREAEQEAKRAATPRKVVYMKRDRCDGGNYYCTAMNADGDVIKTLNLEGVTRKAEAKTAAEQWAEGLTESGGCLVNVEAK